MSKDIEQLRSEKSQLLKELKAITGLMREPLIVKALQCLKKELKNKGECRGKNM